MRSIFSWVLKLYYLSNMSVFGMLCCCVPSHKKNWLYVGRQQAALSHTFDDIPHSIKFIHLSYIILFLQLTFIPLIPSSLENTSYMLILYFSCQETGWNHFSG
jgi:hypothetical protein